MWGGGQFGVRDAAGEMAGETVRLAALTFLWENQKGKKEQGGT